MRTLGSNCENPARVFTAACIDDDEAREWVRRAVQAEVTTEWIVQEVLALRTSS